MPFSSNPHLQFHPFQLNPLNMIHCVVSEGQEGKSSSGEPVYLLK